VTYCFTLKSKQSLPDGLASPIMCRRNFREGASFAQRHRQAFGGQRKARQAGLIVYVYQTSSSIGLRMF